jgi:hypothetical protein
MFTKRKAYKTWNDGRMGAWKAGIMEKWKDGKSEKNKSKFTIPIIPVFH